MPRGTLRLNEDPPNRKQDQRITSTNWQASSSLENFATLRTVLPIK
jgi:hypothetical protein